MGHIRPLVEEDLPAIVDLHNRLFGNLRSYPPEVVRSFYSEIYFRHPWKDGPDSSFVYEDDGGRMIGCLASVRRPMRTKDRTIRMAISNNFMVDPASRGSLAAVELLRTFFAGPQDLSLAEGNLLSRKIWEKVGGSVAYPYSMSWTFALKPSRYVVSALRERGLSAVLASTLWPAASMLDASLGRLRWSPFRVTAPEFSSTPLDAETMLRCLPSLASDYELVPEYDEASLAWLINLLSRRQGLGELRMRAVEGSSEILGWYLYYLKRGGKGQVLQIAARPGSREQVLDHLLDDASRGGAVALSGQVEPRWLAALSQKRSCLFTQTGAWMLVHARDPALLQPFHQGDAFLSRLEGEWWIGM